MRLPALCAALAFVLAGCAGGDEETETAAATVAAPTVSADPAATTPEQVQIAVFERAYSECASTSLELLAAKYKAQKNRIAVSEAVAAAWREVFGAGPDALEDGRAGCLRGFEDA